MQPCNDASTSWEHRLQLPIGAPVFRYNSEIRSLSSRPGDRSRVGRSQPLEFAAQKIKAARFCRSFGQSEIRRFRTSGRMRRAPGKCFCGNRRRETPALFLTGAQRRSCTAASGNAFFDEPVCNRLACGPCWRNSRREDPELSGILVAVDERIVHHHHCSLGIKPESHLANGGCVHGVANRRLTFLFAIK
jgi:hypothetical protein